ncbi:MAG TPA: methylated-DNA--[protein]-cysteine S-methyltransferase [Thermoanaerobaculia bacterium]|nr:methylated-DNA--[protein]-cysteine S-methyltransferase [Thermoanaerobaculia bacterium]
MEAQTRSGTAPESAAGTVRVLMPSPIGVLGVELLGAAVVRVHIEPGEAERCSFLPLHRLDGSDFLDEVFGRLAEYFAGARRKLELEVDFGPCGLSGFARRVLKETAKVPYGRTRTYEGIAEAAGRPGSCRDVLSVLLGNPLPIVVPCHRVVLAAGEPGEYVGGGQRKRWLLELEGRGLEPR